MSDRKEQLKEALGIKNEEEREQVKEVEEEKGKEGKKVSWWSFLKGRDWKFSLGRKRWAFWVLAAAFILFLITQFIIRPLVTGG